MRVLAWRGSFWDSIESLHNALFATERSRTVSSRANRKDVAARYPYLAMVNQDLSASRHSSWSETNAVELASPSQSDADDVELADLGYTRQMPRQFSVLSLMSLSFALTCTWSGTGSSIGVSLTEASTAGTIWSLPIAALMTAIVSAGMAELASAYPVAGAQYYWSFMVSSDKHRALAAYVSGWISVLGWWLGSASVCNFIASMVLAIVTLWYPVYTIERWQQWLVYVGIVWLGVAINVFGSRLIPAFNNFIRRSALP